MPDGHSATKPAKHSKHGKDARPPRANDSRGDIAAALSVFVADTAVLQAKTLAFHWNVEGSNFSGLHALFEAQYRELATANDALAERIRALDAPAPLSLSAMLDLARLSEATSIPDNKGMLNALLDDHRAISDHAADLAEQADEADDVATHDMLVARIITHDKAAWMLKAHLG